MNRYPDMKIAALAVAIVILGSPAYADGFDVRPVTIETSDGMSSVVITNPGDRRIYLETIIYDWSQDGSGNEALRESETAIASPPAMWVSPRSTYNLRVKLPRGVTGRERAFRVMIRQLPDRTDIAAGRIVFALTQSLPAFVEPLESTPAALSARFVDEHHIVIANTGGHRARLVNLTQSGVVLVKGLVGYALPQAALAIALTAPVRPGTIEIETDAGRRTVSLR